MTQRPKVFVTRVIPSIGLERIRSVADIDLWEETLPPTHTQLVERVAGCQGILSLLSDSIDVEVFDSAGNELRVISNYAVGFNNIDISLAKQRNVAVGNTPDVLTDATADLAVTLLLAAARQIQPAAEHVRHGKWKTWEPTGWLGQDLVGKKLGIVGMGRIGFTTAARLHHGWGMKIGYTSNNRKLKAEQQLSAKRSHLNDLLETSDFVSVHTALTPETKNLFGLEEFSKMKPTSVFVNTSRGEVVDQTALHAALTDGKIFAAGLDVTTPEPIAPDHPLVGLPNCIILPHIASATHESRNAMARLAAENLIAGLFGRPLPHPVV